MNRLVIRPAQPADCSLLLGLIKELAEYEKLAHEVRTNEAAVRDSFFGPCPAAEALIAEFAGEPAGFAVYFHNYSTFEGRRGLYLEDIYVRPHLRGQGIGRALFEHLGQVALERNCARFEWSVLNWNEPAIQFYKKHGAVPMSEWTVFRVSGDALARFDSKPA